MRMICLIYLHAGKLRLTREVRDNPHYSSKIPQVVPPADPDEAFWASLQSRQAPSSASSHAGAGSQFRSGSCLVRSEIEPVLWATASRVLPEVLWVATRSWRPLRCSGVSGSTLPGVVYSKRELIPRSPRPSVSLPLTASLHP